MSDDLSVYIVNMTPDLARDWRREKHFPRQRNLSKANIARLAHEIRERRFTDGTPIYVAVLPDGTEYVLNGNHTLEAVCASGASQWLSVISKKVSSLDEAGLIYATFDDHKRRTLGDAARAQGIESLHKMASRIGAAINLIVNDFGYREKSGASSPKIDILNKLGEYEQAAERYLEATEGSQKDIRMFTRRATVMSVGLETMRYQPSAGLEFWSRFSRDNGLKSGDPEKALLRYLRNLGRADGPYRWTITSATSLAWNAAFAGKEINIVRPEATKTFSILGTPWDRGKPVSYLDRKQLRAA